MEYESSDEDGYTTAEEYVEGDNSEAEKQGDTDMETMRGKRKLENADEDTLNECDNGRPGSSLVSSNVQAQRDLTFDELPGPSSQQASLHIQDEEYEYESDSSWTYGPKEGKEEDKSEFSKRFKRMTEKEKVTLKSKTILDKLDGDEQGLAVKDSPVAGRGVFTTKIFLKGDFICEYKGKLVNKEEAKLLRAKYDADPDTFGSYMFDFQVGPNWYSIDATLGAMEGVENTFGRFINHSSKRERINIMPVKGMFHYTPRVYFLATKNLGIGSELFFDYGERDPETIKANPWLRD